MNNYFTHSRHEMLAYVPLNAQRILEIGCASGAFGAQIKKRKATEIWGLELDAVAAAHAIQHLDRVLQGAVEDSLVNLPVGYFDCVVCNDVLEHLADPEAVLRDIKRVMAPGALLVGSVPNVRYFPVLFDLLWNAEWRYADYGVLDRTHQRFFTKNSLARTLLACGYQVNTLVGINRSPSIKASLASALTLGRLRDCRYLQFAFICILNRT